MKKILFFIALFIIVLNNVAKTQGQSIPVSPVTFNTRADIRLQAGGVDNVQAIVMGLLAVDDNNGGTYAWKSTSTATDDGFLTLAVTGVSTGRWVRVGNGNSFKGEIIFSGTGIATAFNYTYATPLPFTPAQVFLQAETGNAAGNWVTNNTTTGFTANFSSVPVLGTNNLIVGYIIIKQ